MKLSQVHGVISNEDKTARLFQNLRLEIFTCPRVISMEALRYNPNNKMTRLFKNIRLDFCMSMHYIISGPQIFVLSPMKTTTVRLFKNLRLEIFTSPCVISQMVLLGYIVILDVHKCRQKGHSGQLSYRVIFQRQFHTS